jgi:orotidine-5'-phosphate decarboxylase
MTTTDPPRSENGAVAVRDRLALALDLPDLAAATGLYRDLAEHIGVAKVGLELWAAAGSATVEALTDLGAEVFLDLKLHDIPTTVGRAATVLGRTGARYVNFHVAGGPAMLRAAVDGLATGAKEAGLPAPTALGVTVLTSEPDARPELLVERATTALEAGCGGLVCGAPDLALLRPLAPGATLVVPGTRPPWAPLDDQRRSATPAEALATGADLLVVGRAVTAADDPRAALSDYVASIT